MYVCVLTKEYAQGQQESEDECEGSIHLLLPVGRVEAVSHTLIELLDERTSCHMENEELRVPNAKCRVSELPTKNADAECRVPDCG